MSTKQKSTGDSLCPQAIPKATPPPQAVAKAIPKAVAEAVPKASPPAVPKTLAKPIPKTAAVLNTGTPPPKLLTKKIVQPAAKSWPKDTSSKPVGSVGSVVLVDYRNRGAQLRDVSGNLGDHIQSIAVMRLVLRWLRVWALVGAAQSRRTSPRAGSAPLPNGEHAYPYITTCPRDEHRIYHPSALLLLYGWHMHKAHDNCFAFPPCTMRAFVFSFHVAAHQILTPQAVSYLATVGPIGCRDFSTLTKLRFLNVPSYYSGCVTLTLGSRIRGKPPIDHRRGGFIAVDTPRPNASYALIRMCIDQNRYLSQRNQWLRALSVLRALRRTSHVQTSRLHVFYPCLALRTKATIAAPNGDTRKTDWGSPGRWATAHQYAAGIRDSTADAQRLERQLASALGRALAGESISVAWRTATLIHVAYCFDANFVIPTGASINSLLCHNGDLPIFLHLFHSGVHDGALMNLRQRILTKHPGTMMQLHDMNSIDLKSTYASHLNHVSPMTQARLWLPERLSSQVRRVIYLDGDVIVSGSILPLIDMKVPIIAGRPSNGNIMEERRWNRGLEWKGKKCFNAGVLIMNLAALRKQGFVDWARKTLVKQSANDQTLLNLFCQGNFVVLDRKWNLYVSQLDDVRLGAAEAKITHYCGSKKPWNSDGKKSCPLAPRWHAYNIF